MENFKLSMVEWTKIFPNKISSSSPVKLSAA